MARHLGLDVREDVSSWTMADTDPARPDHAGPTRLSDIANLASPEAAPHTIRFSAANEHIFQSLRFASYPGGHSMERGGTIVADAQGQLSIQNTAGLKAKAGEVHPDLTLKEPKKFSVVGIFHTHPYDRSEEPYNGVSLSGGDLAYLIIYHHTIILAQSGPRLFALLRTARSPAHVDYNKLNNGENQFITHIRKLGHTFQQASRIAIEEQAPRYGVAYYQGSHGVLTRVYPR